MIYSLAYALNFALSITLLRFYSLDISIWTLMVLNSGYSILFYHLIALRSSFHLLSAVFHNKKTCLLTGLSIAITWIITYWIASTYSAGTFSIVYTIVPALWGSLIYYRRSRERANLIRALAFLFVLLALYLYSAIRLSPREAIYLVPLSIVLGVANVIYFQCSDKLLKANLSSIEILAIRLWPILIISLAACSVDHFEELSPRIALIVLPLTLVSTLLPNYLGQKSIEHVGGKRHAIIISFIPVLTCICEVFILKEYHISLIILSAVLLFALLVKRPDHL